jgi:hypothetical protein
MNIYTHAIIFIYIYIYIRIFLVRSNEKTKKLSIYIFFKINSLKKSAQIEWKKKLKF